MFGFWNLIKIQKLTGQNRREYLSLGTQVIPLPREISRTHLIPSWKIVENKVTCSPALCFVLVVCYQPLLEKGFGGSCVSGLPQHGNSFLWYALFSCWRVLTYDLNCYCNCICHIFYLKSDFICSWVMKFCLSDEKDCVRAAVPNSHIFGV